jgi:hypothetical protein
MSLVGRLAPTKRGLRTIVIGWVGRSFRDLSPLKRAGAAALTLGVFAVSAPFIGLFAHCTSGDCL